ncbi:hypothetical protein L2E82_34585 [Cichorium intybus]|uniref:Uncharacterized protein n=1 Tax=Cichorium intybus TaxID=13427 RepID=A0ACB9BMP2_CICIN|nr:hypothetical protein L2E82_34585 [Cichorium intybus]
MSLFYMHLLIIFISLAMAETALVPSYVKPGCTEMCGNVSIPYPFGIGPNCSLNKWYNVDCNSSSPYLSALKNLSLLGVDLDEQMVLVNVTMTPGCQKPLLTSSEILNVDLGDSPFLFSKSHNKFIVKGCGSAVVLSHGTVLTGCSTLCLHHSVNYIKKSCSGINCCQTEVPYYLKTYTVNVTNSDRQTDNKSCLSAFMLAAQSYVDDQFFLGQSVSVDNSHVPIVLKWTLTENDINKASCGFIKTHKLEMSNDTASSVTCTCQSEEEGNPYLSGGCQVTEECRKCMETRGFCRYNESGGGVRKFFCDHHSHDGGNRSSSPRAVFLGVGISIVWVNEGCIHRYEQRRKYFDKMG